MRWVPIFRLAFELLGSATKWSWTGCRLQCQRQRFRAVGYRKLVDQGRTRGVEYVLSRPEPRSGDFQRTTGEHAEEETRDAADGEEEVKVHLARPESSFVPGNEKGDTNSRKTSNDQKDSRVASGGGQNPLK